MMRITETKLMDFFCDPHFLLGSHPTLIIVLFVNNFVLLSLNAVVWLLCISGHVLPPFAVSVLIRFPCKGPIKVIIYVYFRRKYRVQKYVLGHPVDTPALILLFIELFAVRVRRVRKFRKFKFLLSLNSKLPTQTKKKKIQNPHPTHPNLFKTQDFPWFIWGAYRVWR